MIRKTLVFYLLALMTAGLAEGDRLNAQGRTDGPTALRSRIERRFEVQIGRAHV